MFFRFSASPASRHGGGAESGKYSRAGGQEGSSQLSSKIHCQAVIISLFFPTLLVRLRTLENGDFKAFWALNRVSPPPSSAKSACRITQLFDIKSERLRTVGILKKIEYFSSFQLTKLPFNVFN